ncbi:hypothetical protein KY289_009278 [Solanum tuberosum]|nr:hypothetical protein KY289_009278 [Solanum tuberosum]
MEPFEDRQELEEYRKKLDMKHAVVNINGKIWAFIDELMEYTIERDEEQGWTSKCQYLWYMLNVHKVKDYNYGIPWLVGGDFNVIRNEEEKLGGRPVTNGEVVDFNHCINVCNLEDQGFKGIKYTWWNGRTDEDCIFKRLDRVLCNEKMQNTFPGKKLNIWCGVVLIILHC